MGLQGTLGATMTGRQSSAVERAVGMVLFGATVSSAANASGCAQSSVRRALRLSGVPPLPRGRPRSRVTSPGPEDSSGHRDDDDHHDS